MAKTWQEWWVNMHGGKDLVERAAVASEEWVRERGGTVEQSARVGAMMRVVAGEMDIPGADGGEIAIGADAEDGKQLVMTRRQEKFLAGVAEGRTPREALLAAGYKDRDPAKLVNHCRKRFRELLRQRITLQKIADKLAEGMEATETRLASDGGRFTDEKVIVDFAERRKTTEVIARLLGLEEDRRQEQSGNRTTVILAPWQTERQR